MVSHVLCGSCNNQCHLTSCILLINGLKWIAFCCMCSKLLGIFKQCHSFSVLLVYFSVWLYIFVFGNVPQLFYFLQSKNYRDLRVGRLSVVWSITRKGSVKEFQMGRLKIWKRNLKFSFVLEHKHRHTQEW